QGWDEFAHNAYKDLAIRFPAKAGIHQVAASFVEELVEPDGLIQKPPARGRAARRSLSEPDDNDIEAPRPNPEVESITIGGPYKFSGSGDPESRRKIFVCRPTRRSDEEACAKTVLARLARRAYRRPATDAELQTLLGFYRTARNQASFDEGIQSALERLLV